MQSTKYGKGRKRERSIKSRPKVRYRRLPYSPPESITMNNSNKKKNEGPRFGYPNFVIPDRGLKVIKIATR